VVCLPAVSHILPSHPSIWSNAVVKSTQKCTLATSKPGERLAGLKGSAVFIRDGAQLSLDTQLRAPSNMEVTNSLRNNMPDLAGPENAAKYKTWLYLTASASAEFIADLALCPFEAVKVRMQTTIPPFAKGTFDGISTITAKEGFGGLYKGLYPLWGRQIPYTMMKFASFETIVEMIYERLPGQKSDYGKGAQTAVSFTGGYLAGILCAIVSHPADVMVSKLNANRAPGEAFGAAMGRIYKDIGFAGLWNGLPVRIVMIGTLTGLQWMIYDYFKIFMGLPTTGGAPPKAEKA